MCCVLCVSNGVWCMCARVCIMVCVFGVCDVCLRLEGRPKEWAIQKQGTEFRGHFTHYFLFEKQKLGLFILLNFGCNINLIFKTPYFKKDTSARRE